MKWLAIAASVFGVDYSAKDFINRHKIQGTETAFLKGKLIIRNLHNQDGAFGILKGQESGRRKLSLLVLGAILWEFARTLPQNGNKLSKLGLALALGGGLNNYCEWEKKGYVTDYLSLNAGPRRLKNTVWNLSDICIFAGALFYLAGYLHSKK